MQNDTQVMLCARQINQKIKQRRSLINTVFRCKISYL